MELVIDGLSAWYGQAQALRSVSLHVGRGEVVGVFGRNGAGKTTLLRSVARLIGSVSGTVTMGGARVDALNTTDLSRFGMSLVREGAALPHSLTVEENVRLGQKLAKRRGSAPPPLAEVWETFPLLATLRARQAGVLSGGQRQTLALAVAYASRPKLLLLDEPSAGLSPQTVRSVFDVIGALAAGADLTALVVEQRPESLRGIASRSYLIELGAIAGEGTIDELLTSAAGRPITP